jgi:hypothetical protein
MLPIDLLLIIVSQSDTKAKPFKPRLGKEAYAWARFSAGFEALSDLAIRIRLIAFKSITVTARVCG